MGYFALCVGGLVPSHAGRSPDVEREVGDDWKKIMLLIITPLA
jgi:hypothetical protein